MIIDKSIFLKNTLDLIKEKYYMNSFYSNTTDNITEEVGYKIFSESILKTKNKEHDGFIDFIGKNGEKIHNDAIEHYSASQTNIFGKNYNKWKEFVL